jgi:hypothetical protein
MRAILIRSVLVFTRPTYSSMRFGLFPAAAIVVGFSISLAIGFSQSRNGLHLVCLGVTPRG